MYKDEGYEIEDVSERLKQELESNVPEIEDAIIIFSALCRILRIHASNEGACKHILASLILLLPKHGICIVQCTVYTIRCTMYIVL